MARSNAKSVRAGAQRVHGTAKFTSHQARRVGTSEEVLQAIREQEECEKAV
jgi:hypothetical protein